MCVCVCVCVCVCFRRHTAADCYLRFETLSMREEKVYYHCDQVCVCVCVRVCACVCV